MSTSEIDFQMNFDDNQQSDADKRLLVAFFRAAEKNEFKSIEAGRPIYEERDLIKIITPGSRDSFVGDATEQYQTRFPQQWARYKAGKDQNISGTPLNLLPWLSMSQVAEFEAVGCKTVEQLVGMSDALAHKFMGFHGIREKAKQYLDIAAGNAPLIKMQSELEKRDEQIAELKATVDALVAKQKAAPAKTT
jgi:hypothetical protein